MQTSSNPKELSIEVLKLIDAFQQASRPVPLRRFATPRDAECAARATAHTALSKESIAEMREALKEKRSPCSPKKVEPPAWLACFCKQAQEEPAATQPSIEHNAPAVSFKGADARRAAGAPAGVAAGASAGAPARAPAGAPAGGAPRTQSAQHRSPHPAPCRPRPASVAIPALPCNATRGAPSPGAQSARAPLLGGAGNDSSRSVGAAGGLASGRTSIRSQGAFKGHGFPSSTCESSRATATTLVSSYDGFNSFRPPPATMVPSFRPPTARRFADGMLAPRGGSAAGFGAASATGEVENDKEQGAGDATASNALLAPQASEHEYEHDDAGIVPGMNELEAGSRVTSRSALSTDTGERRGTSFTRASATDLAEEKLMGGIADALGEPTTAPPSTTCLGRVFKFLMQACCLVSCAVYFYLIIALDNRSHRHF